ncbi:hypothetical protein GQ43DRAFT_430076 [Delitschia confertaspora ATCC 74209]|uniref:Uncharacterized protein n=1 Tax=Delitschia confertaspora ATCC 74209 TaxID=1513339 RepID=A0A9P4JPY8_9PLEO|nr:hypothetical protein GQ43DRAFT_430076 [Delitschia confertaspora ATCC 74209]
MDTASNIASAAANTASKIIWGDKNQETQRNETGGQEPISGQQGKGTIDEPYDQGNKASPTDDPTSLSSNTASHTTSNISGFNQRATADNPTVLGYKPPTMSNSGIGTDKPHTSTGNYQTEHKQISDFGDKVGSTPCLPEEKSIFAPDVNGYKSTSYGNDKPTIAGGLSGDNSTSISGIGNEKPIRNFNDSSDYSNEKSSSTGGFTGGNTGGSSYGLNDNSTSTGGFTGGDSSIAGNRSSERGNEYKPSSTSEFGGNKSYGSGVAGDRSSPTYGDNNKSSASGFATSGLDYNPLGNTGSKSGSGYDSGITADQSTSSYGLDSKQTTSGFGGDKSYASGITGDRSISNTGLDNHPSSTGTTHIVGGDKSYDSGSGYGHDTKHTSSSGLDETKSTSYSNDRTGSLDEPASSTGGNSTGARVPYNTASAATGGVAHPHHNTEKTGVIGNMGNDPKGHDVYPSESNPNPGAAPFSGARPTQKQQGADRPGDEPTGREADAVRDQKEAGEEVLKKRDPNDHSGEPMKMHGGEQKLGATQEERRNSTIGNPGGQEHGKEQGTGEQWVKTSGLAAEGGNFDATLPGAGREADRLLESKGIHKTVGGPAQSTNPGAHADDDHKVSMGEKIKNKLHIGHKS